MEKISKVAVIGAGWMGVQIAAHAAARGYEVSIFDQDLQAFSRGVARLGKAGGGKGGEPLFSYEHWQAAAEKVAIAGSLKQAAGSADLVVETVPENLEIKREIFSQIDALSPPETIIATNSSSMPVSKLEDATGRPERCLNLHFYQPTIACRMVDVMGGTQTLPEVLEAGAGWVRSLGSLPLRVNKEILGFCFNRIWRAVKKETLHMWADGFVDFRDIDRAWMIFTGMRLGPFGLMDAVGLDVVSDIENVYFTASGDPADSPPEALLEKVNKGQLGRKAAKGFYDYPEPEFKKDDFLKP